MTRRTIGIVDYGVGNLASVWRTLHRLGYRCRVSHEPEVLDATDLVVLPGVGAFPTAMANLERHGLVGYLQEQARQERPIVGLCLGMQVLVDASSEHRLTAGLGLIPGEVVSFGKGRWHTGWNTLEVVGEDPLLQPSDGESVYFNHSYTLEVPSEYHLALTRLDRPFASAVRRGSIVGLQFHPEKSQRAGRELLRNVIEGLCGA